MRKSTKVVALEQHMDSITVAVAGPGRQAPELCGDIPSTPEAVSKLARRLDEGTTHLRFCYEAGPCGYGLYDADGLRVQRGGPVAVAATAGRADQDGSPGRVGAGGALLASK